MSKIAEEIKVMAEKFVDDECFSCDVIGEHKAEHKAEQAYLTAYYQSAKDTIARIRKEVERQHESLYPDSPSGLIGKVVLNKILSFLSELEKEYDNE